MIIINDGSTDQTLEIARSYSEKDKRILLADQENVGIFRIGETYNKALALSRGEYVFILEGDDLWEPEKLELQINAFQNNPEVILCYGRAKVIGSDPKLVFNTIPETGVPDEIYYNNDPIGSILNVILFEDRVPALTIGVKRQILEKIGGFKQGLASVDLDTLLELSLIGKFHFLPKILGSYRTYANQVTKTYPALIREKYYQTVIKFLDEKAGQENIKWFTRKNQIHSYHKRYLSIAYSRSGRYNLIRKKFNEARHDYLTAIRTGSINEPLWVLRSITGIVLSFFKTDVEGLAKFFGKKHYTKD